MSTDKTIRACDINVGGFRPPLAPERGEGQGEGRLGEQKKQWLLQRAKELRRNQTPQETELWGMIRAKRFEGLKFYRQYVVASYIVDFCCPEKMLVVELDGSGHTERENKDQQRDKDLRKLGYRVIRVWNSDWNTNRNGVLEIIAEAAKTPLSGPLPVMGRGEDPSNRIKVNLKSTHIYVPHPTIRIVQALREAYSNFSKTQAEKLIRGGKVLVDGKPICLGSRVASGTKICLVDTATKLTPNPKLPCRLLRQTKDFFFLEKPTGTHSVALDFDETNSVANWLMSLDPAQSELDPLEAGLVHRLDFETSGIMVAAKNAAAKKILEKSFREHRIRKEYVCLIDKAVKPGRYRAYGGKNPKSDKKIHIQERASQKLTSLRTEILSVTKAASGFLVRVNLITGYRHQIRAHLALLGSPIRGDKLYGGAKAERLYLHACQLEVMNRDGGKILVESEFIYR